MNKNWITLIWIFLVFVNVVFSHSGKTDRWGGHAGTQPYHFHSPKNIKEKSMTIKEALNLIQIHANNNMSILEGRPNQWKPEDAEELSQIRGNLIIAMDILNRLTRDTNDFLSKTKGFKTD